VPRVTPAAMRRTGNPSGHDLRTGEETTLLIVLMEQMVIRVPGWWPRAA
jgi:hypothetical protein